MNVPFELNGYELKFGDIVKVRGVDSHRSYKFVTSVTSRVSIGVPNYEAFTWWGLIKVRPQQQSLFDPANIVELVMSDGTPNLFFSIDRGVANMTSCSKIRNCWRSDIQGGSTYRQLY